MIDICRAVAAKDRVEGQATRGVGQRNITIAMDMFLTAKKNISKGGFSRKKLSDYCRRRKRWSILARLSSISIFVFSRAADTIVYVLPHSFYLFGKSYYLDRQNNSILNSTVQALAAQVRHDHPKLFSVLDDVGLYSGLAPLSTKRGMPRIEDVISRTNNTSLVRCYALPPE